MARLTLLVLLFVAALLNAAATPAAGPELKTDEDKTFYALGLAFGPQLAPFKLAPSELELVKAGISDAVLNKEKRVDFDAFRPKLQQLAQARQAAAAAEEKKAAQAFLEKAAAEKGVTKTASGLIYSEITPGTGEHPTATDKVKVHYHGTLADGTVFDSSVQRGEPATFPLNGVIKCWTEGVQLMKVGGKSKLICPSDIAYGDRGSPPKIKPGAALIFEVQLLEIVK